MILLDALHINIGGGKVLLDYLIEELENTNIKIYYLLDERVKDNIPIIKTNNIVQFSYAGFINRYFFYKKNRQTFSSILCFGNLPPYVRVKVPTYTYLHQAIYLNIPQNFTLLDKILFRMKTFILNRIKKNTDYWIVQNDLMKEAFSQKYKVSPDSILVLPFYPPLLATKDKLEVSRLKNSYIFVSNATPNKNHLRLIEAFCVFFDRNHLGKLTLTVSDDYLDVKKIIDQKIQEGYPFKNIGFIDRADLASYYQENEYLIFPSLSESLGLGIIEAIDAGCKVIGADLPYMHAICEPSIVFNPLEISSIVNAFEKSLDNQNESISFVQNKIEDIINILK